MRGRVVTVNGGAMNASPLRQTRHRQRSGIYVPWFSTFSSPFAGINGSDSSSQDSLRKRIQRIETLLHGRQPSAEPQHSISSALAGIEKLLGIPPLEPSDQTQNTIITPVLINDPTLSPTTLPSPSGSQSSQLRTAFLAEANHKRWGAESAIGQSWSKVLLSPFLRTLVWFVNFVDVDFGDGSSVADFGEYVGTARGG